MYEKEFNWYLLSNQKEISEVQKELSVNEY